MPGARDGQLRIRRGADSPPWALQLFDDDLGLWLTLAQADEEEEMVRAGIPILRGPYVVDFSDIPHDGDSTVLWTPAVGDVLLRLFCDWQTVTEWDHGSLFVGQGVDGVSSPHTNVLTVAGPGSLGGSTEPALDTVGEGLLGNVSDAAGTGHYASAYVFHTTDPVQIQLAQTGGTDPTVGHVALYALVARAVAP